MASVIHNIEFDSQMFKKLKFGKNKKKVDNHRGVIPRRFVLVPFLEGSLAASKELSS